MPEYTFHEYTFQPPFTVEQYEAVLLSGRRVPSYRVKDSRGMILRGVSTRQEAEAIVAEGEGGIYASPIVVIDDPDAGKLVKGEHSPTMERLPSGYYYVHDPDSEHPGG